MYTSEIEPDKEKLILVQMEEPKHNSMEIYSQCLTRTTTTDGHIMMTCTPEAGYTALQKLYAEDETGLLYLDSASWDEAPHITEDDIKRLLAGVPRYQWDMRRHGLPVLGSGAVFPYPDEDISCDVVPIQPHWPVLASLDFSSVNDASIIAYCAYDPDKDIYYAYDLVYIDRIEDKNPKYMANVILNSTTPSIPTISPHDGGIKSVNPEAKARIMKDLGVNILGEPFFNPSNLNLPYYSINGKNRDREPGLTEMRRLFEEGKLKIAKHIKAFFKEKGQMFYVPTATGMATKGDDDAIDAIRYGILSLRGHRGVQHCMTTSRILENNGFIYDPSSSPNWD